MTSEIVQFLLENGEKTVPQMRFPHLTRSSLNGKLRNLFEKGAIDRRMVTTSKGDIWSYFLRNLFEKGAIDRRMVTTSKGDIWSYFAVTGPDRPHQFRNEPDSVYFLRNLPKENFLENSIQLLEESHG